MVLPSAISHGKLGVMKAGHRIETKFLVVLPQLY